MSIFEPENGTNCWPNAFAMAKPGDLIWRSDDRPGLMTWLVLKSEPGKIVFFSLRIMQINYCSSAQVGIARDVWVLRSYVE